MCGDNRYVDDLRILTAIELYLNSEFYSKHPSFISLIKKHSKVFSSVDTILAISVSHSALDSNKTKGELVQNEAINIYTSFKWAGFLCVLALASVCSSSVQCYYKSTGSILKYKLMFSQLIEPRLFNPFSSLSESKGKLNIDTSESGAVVRSVSSSPVLNPKLLFSSEKSRNVEKSLFIINLEVPISCSEKSEKISSSLEIPNQCISRNISVNNLEESSDIISTSKYDNCNIN